MLSLLALELEGLFEAGKSSAMKHAFPMLFLLAPWRRVSRTCSLPLVHALTNLFDWVALVTVTNPGSRILTNYPDPIGSAPSRRFYRVSLP
jgi:hypothetical protein